MNQKQDTERQVIAAATAFAAGDVTYDEAAPAPLPPLLDPDSEPMVQIGIRVPVQVAERIRAAGTKAGVPYSQLCREWIEQGLTEQDGNASVAVAELYRLIAHAAQGGRAA